MQLTLDLRRHLCADAVLATACSTASADRPRINPIWRAARFFSFEIARAFSVLTESEPRL
jgi:hypothetical protein